MTLFILTETSAGYALHKAKDKKLLKHDLPEEAHTAEGICSLLKLKSFSKFDSAATALNEAAALTDGKARIFAFRISRVKQRLCAIAGHLKRKARFEDFGAVTPMLSSLLDSLKDEKKASLAVMDPKLGNAIKKLPQLSITPISDASTADLFRAIRSHLPSLIAGLTPKDIDTMSLGLSHSLSRHKLRFSPDKVDTMIIQAIALLDDLDKELNTYAMRVKEWYGWHFPEVARIINDNVAYAKVILAMGMRTNASNADLSEILPEEIEAAVKAAAEVSMGTEITDEDLENIRALAEQVVSFTEYRAQLANYLATRMQAIAPNLTALVGELVGARLIAHAGSLMNLAKSPGSTIQILGAEKALFRALKTKHDTPKYGLIYHASLIGQATGRNKGKIARMLASKAALGLRVDSLSDWGQSGEGKLAEPTEEEKRAVGVNARLTIERRLRNLEGKPLRPTGAAIGPGGQAKPGKWEPAAAHNAPPAKTKVEVRDVKMGDANAGAEDDDDDDEDEDEEMEELVTKTKLNGDAEREVTTKDKKQQKQAEKDAKIARKLARAEKRERKEAKRAAKEAKKEGKEVKKEKKNKEDGESGKKRKREEADGEEKKKKKKSKA
ncbi:Nucleolar protein 58 [Coniosporium tulheliwenetii]|uniref:Nucleolar protein 58 n=1 Tax=Coniosporium tulheliwenetii TaxID=3383036 RepID=A0ACC2Z6N7_9PEZI|nr:Nucleolar protein 58 [Cladosporium sp. JES 115]